MTRLSRFALSALAIAALGSAALLARDSQVGPGTTTPYVPLSPATIAATNYVFVPLSPRQLERVRVTPQAALVSANKWATVLRLPDTTVTISLGAITEPGAGPPIVRMPAYVVTYHPVRLIYTGFVAAGQKPKTVLKDATQVEVVNAVTGQPENGAGFTG